MICVQCQEFSGVVEASVSVIDADVRGEVDREDWEPQQRGCVRWRILLYLSWREESWARHEKYGDWSSRLS